MVVSSNGSSGLVRYFADAVACLTGVCIRGWLG